MQALEKIKMFEHLLKDKFVLINSVIFFASSKILLKDGH